MNTAPELMEGASAEAALQRTFPEGALDEILLVEDASRDLLHASRRAYAAGARTLVVPPALGGGRLGWEVPLGQLRQAVVQRLDALVSAGQVRRPEADAVIVRFGLHGASGGAHEARATLGRSRQATSDAVNRVLKDLAADLAMQPLMPVPAPRLDLATRQLIVGATLSLMRGPGSEFALRQYVHMKVRAELLNDPEFPVVARSDAARQERHRLTKQWVAIASDHLDRGVIPWALLAPVEQTDREELSVWRDQDPRTAPTPSIGALRALMEHGEDHAVDAMGDAQGAVGLMLDGYRPMIELLRVASWLHAGPDAGTWRALGGPEGEGLRSAGILNVSELLALRGYPDAAVLLSGRAHDLGTESHRSSAWARFRRLMVLESVSYLRGATSVEETRRWQAALVDHLNRHGAAHHGEPLAVAIAIFRAEHAAWTASAASGASIAELVAPLGDSLTEAVAKAPTENRRRFEIVRARLGKVLDDQDALALDRQGDAAVHVADPLDGEIRSDEWYCANNVAISRWDARGTPRGQDEWRR